MPDARTSRISRELFLAAFGAGPGHMEPWVIDRLTAVVDEDDARRGDTLYRIGDAPDGIYFLRQGRVELVPAKGPGRITDGPSVLGMFDAVLDRPRTRRAMALTDLQLLRVPVEAWIELLEDSFQLARLSVTSLARSVAQLEERAWAQSPPAPRRPAVPAPTSASRLGRLERLVVLVDTPLLRGAGVQTLSDLAGVSEEASFEAGDDLFVAGARRDRVHIIVTGEVEAQRESPRVEWRGGPGEIVCDAASLGETEVAWGARAVTRVRTLAFRFDDWLDLMEEHFEMVRSTLGALALQCERLTG